MSEGAHGWGQAHLTERGCACGGPGSHDFVRAGTLAGDLSLPSDADTPHSRNNSTPSSIGRLQRIGAAQLWQARAGCQLVPPALIRSAWVLCHLLPATAAATDAACRQ